MLFKKKEMCDGHEKTGDTWASLILIMQLDESWKAI